jgi:hypothetical protein
MPLKTQALTIKISSRYALTVCLKAARMQTNKALEPWTAAHVHLDHEYISLLNSTGDASKTPIFKEKTAEYSCVPMCQYVYASAGLSP